MSLGETSRLPASPAGTAQSHKPKPECPGWASLAVCYPVHTPGTGAAACGFTPQMSSSVSCVAIACCTPGWTRAEQLGSPTQVSLGELNLPSPALPPK